MCITYTYEKYIPYHVLTTRESMRMKWFDLSVGGPHLQSLSPHLKRREIPKKI